MASRLFEIQDALNAHLNAYQSTNVAWPNATADYTPSSDTPYLAVHNVFFTPIQATLGEGGGENLISGIYQIDVFFPTGEGWSDLFDKIDAILDHFKRGTILSSGGTTIRVTNAGLTGVLEGDDEWTKGIVEIYWESFVPNA